jgi:hypothetical protein
MHHNKLVMSCCFSRYSLYFYFGEFLVYRLIKTALFTSRADLTVNSFRFLFCNSTTHKINFDLSLQNVFFAINIVFCTD